MLQKLKIINGIEILDVKAPSLQLIDNIILEIGLPYTIIKCEPEDILTAIQIIAVKTVGGFADPDDFKIFYKNHEINIRKIMF